MHALLRVFTWSLHSSIGRLGGRHALSPLCCRALLAALPQKKAFSLMTSTRSLADELSAISSWLQTQQSSLPAAAFDRVKQSQKWYHIGRIKAQKLEAADAATVTQALQGGPWSESDLADFAAATSEAMTAKKSSRRPNQVVTSFHKFFSVNDVKVLADVAQTKNAKVDVVACRMVKVRLWLASEKSYKIVTQTAMNAGLNLMKNPDKIHEFICDLKAAVRAKTRYEPKTLELQYQFSEDPDGLPDDVREEAYKEDEPGMLSDEKNLMDAPGGTVPLRTSNAQLARNARKDELALPSSSRGPGRPTESMQQMAGAFMHMMQQAMSTGRFPDFGAEVEKSDDLPQGFKLLQTPKAKPAKQEGVIPKRPSPSPKSAPSAGPAQLGGTEAVEPAALRNLFDEPGLPQLELANIAEPKKDDEAADEKLAAQVAMEADVMNNAMKRRRELAMDEKEEDDHDNDDDDDEADGVI